MHGMDSNQEKKGWIKKNKGTFEEKIYFSEEISEN